MLLLLARWQQAGWMIFFLVLLLVVNALRSHKRKLVLLGDSITEQGSRHGGFVGLLMEHLGEAWQKKYELVNKGLGGNKIGDLMLRLHNDVIALRPTLTIVNIGLNDVWHRYHPTAVGTATEQFVGQLLELVQALQSQQLALVLCTTTRPDPESWTEEMLAELDYLNACIAQCAHEQGLPLCDLYTAFHQAQQPPHSSPGQPLTTDGVHLNALGNQLVAQCLLPYLQNPRP